MAPKRVKASRDKIEKTLAAAIATGLAPTSISFHPDGSFEVHFGGGVATDTNSEPTGWEDF